MKRAPNKAVAPAAPVEPTPIQRLLDVDDTTTRTLSVLRTIDQAMRAPLEGAEDDMSIVLFEHAISPLRQAMLSLGSAIDQLRAGIEP